MSSGTYVIDSEFNIVTANETARSIYPQLKTGEKCYACLMGLDQPCGPCPVVNGVKGPRTYLDPIRHLSESVDAVEMDLEGYGHCYSLVFSTVGTAETLAATLPTSSEDLKNLALIEALTVDYYDVFSVDLENGELLLYRQNGISQGADSVYKAINDYEKAVTRYIDKDVLAEDRARVRKETSLSYIREKLEKAESFIVHYRVLFDGKLRYFYRKIVRVGSAEDFRMVIIGVADEDEDVLNRQRNRILEKNLAEVEYDSLTGLYTREAFFLYGGALFEVYPELSFDFCIMKLKNLSLINHQYGRAVGDKILSLIGHLLKEYESATSCIGYLGDGTFVSLTENTDVNLRKNNIFRFKSDILRQSSQKNLSMKWSIYKELSGRVSLEEITAKTDYALSTILADLHQDYVEFDHSMIEQMEWESFVDFGFEAALQEEQYIAWFQPKYSTQTGKMEGAEALVRWKLPDGQMVPPGRFIPVLENREKIGMLDEYIFRRICRFQKDRLDNGRKVVPISVNLSRASMFSDDLPERYFSIIEEYGVAPWLIPIEITESAAIRAVSIRHLADELVRKGFSLHMDDFGSGYSSLASLQILPFESIKLDKTLIDFIGQKSGENLIRHTIAFARESGKTVIAEGVEDSRQVEFLKKAGCDMIQGYYYSRPVCEEEFIRKLEEEIE